MTRLIASALMLVLLIFGVGALFGVLFRRGTPQQLHTAKKPEDGQENTD